MKTKFLTLAFFALVITNLSYASCSSAQADEEVVYPKIDLSISK